MKGFVSRYVLSRTRAFLGVSSGGVHKTKQLTRPQQQRLQFSVLYGDGEGSPERNFSKLKRTTACGGTTSDTDLSYQ